MGLYREGIGFMATARRLGVDFDRTLTLGRQLLLVDHSRLCAGMRDAGNQMTSSEARTIIAQAGGYAEPLLGRLGATRIDSIDANDYEQSTIIHDLNEPLPHELREQFSLVLDGGTLEHVFNYPAALGNALEAVALGGHFVAVAPTNGYVGHGFYQLSPELFYRVLGPANGFRVVCMLLKPLHWRAQWRSVPDPVDVGGRVVWRGAWPTNLYVLAQRVEIVPILRRPVLQSDYVAVWATDVRATSRPAPRALASMKSWLPLPVREIRESLTTWRASRRSLDAVKLMDLISPPDAAPAAGEGR